jgi:hypothetical protein
MEKNSQVTPFVTLIFWPILTRCFGLELIANENALRLTLSANELTFIRVGSQFIFAGSL